MTKLSEWDTNMKELERRMSETSLDSDSCIFFSYCVSYRYYHCSQGASNLEVVAFLSRFVLLRQSYFFYIIAMLLGMARVH
jgi:hypothetical protein